MTTLATGDCQHDTTTPLETQKFQDLHSYERDLSNTAGPGQEEPDSCRTGGYENERSFLPIVVAGQPLNALPDTKSCNVITEKKAKELGATVNRDKSQRRLFRNAVGNSFRSNGTVEMDVALLDGGYNGREVFQVVSRCPSEVILGRAFLAATQTLDRYRHRLKKMTSTVASRAAASFRLFRMEGGISYKLSCEVDGDSIFADLDTGSDRDLASLEYARSREWKVRKMSQGKVSAVLADGQVISVAGYVDTDLSVGDTTQQKRFYIIEDLFCDMLLGDSTIDSLDIFNEFEDFIRELPDDDNDEAEGDAFCLVEWVEGFNHVEAEVESLLSGSPFPLQIGTVPGPKRKSRWRYLFSLPGGTRPRTSQAISPQDLRIQLRRKLEEVDSMECMYQRRFQAKSAQLGESDLAEEQSIEAARTLRYRELRQKILLYMRNPPPLQRR